MVIIILKKWEHIKAYSWKNVSPKSKDKTDPFPTGSATKLTTPSDTTLSVDIGEEQN